MRTEEYKEWCEAHGEWPPEQEILARLPVENKALRAEVERLRAECQRWYERFELLRTERDKLRAQRSEFDCRFTGDVADIAGSHCPADEPCLRCQIEQLRADLDGERIAHKVCVEMRNAAEAEVKRLREGSRRA